MCVSGGDELNVWRSVLEPAPLQRGLVQDLAVLL